MIYFLINNNYHFELDVKLAMELNNYELGLIQVPYSLNVIHSHKLFKKVICFNNRLHTSLKRLLFKPFYIINIKKLVDKNIVINKDDILLVHTEIDFTNQYIIQKFYEKQARVFLLEDGISTMCSYNLPLSKPSISERFKGLLLRRVYNFKYTTIVKLGNLTLPIMLDNIFTGSIVNYGESIRRDIPLFRLKQEFENLELKHQLGALFLSQALYYWFLSEEEYIKFIDNILIISKKFSPFYFKFHPSEKESVKKSIELLINHKYPEVSIVTENIVAEKLIYKLQLKYAISINSTATFSLINKGIVPIFLNELYCNKFPNSEGEEFSNFLNSINCNFPKTIAEVKPGFVAFDGSKEDKNSYSIKEILSLK